MRNPIFLVLAALGAALLCSCDDDLIEVPNNPPTLELGAQRDILTGSAYVIFPERVGDFDGDPLSYDWTLKTRPAGSTAVLKEDQSANPSITPDVQGNYLISVEVSDGRAAAADSLFLRALNVISGVTFSQVQSAMLTVTNGSGQTCGTCHTVNHTWASAASNLVTPTSSPLLTKPISGSNSGHSFGGRGWSPGEGTYELVLDWIQQGAPNN